MAETPPANESRVKKTLLNARVNLIFYFLTLALSFFSRKIFLDTLGADFVGLTGTLQNLLGFLNLAELGIGSAIGYVLYKPLYDKDQQKINEIISVMGYMYRWIGIVILVAGCILALFLPFIFPNTEFDLSLIYFAYLSFLASSLIGYFINYRQNLLGADQRNYVVTAYYQSMTIGKTLLQMALAYYTCNYYLWVIVELTFGIVYSFVLNWKIDQTYPWLRAEIKLGKALFKKYPEVMKYTRQLFVHKIGTFVQFQTTPFIIYSFVSLKIVAYYGNYTIVTDKLGQFLSNFLDSAGAGVGNLISEGNESKIWNIFHELQTLRFFAAGSLLYAVYISLPGFIALWIGEEYLLSDVVLYLVLISFLLSTTRGTVDQFLFGYGLFSDTWAPLVESLIYVVVAICGGFLWGLEGVLLGGIVSKIAIISIWKPYFLFTKGFRKSVLQYWILWFRLFLLMVLSILLVNAIWQILFPLEQISQSWMNWLFYSAIAFGMFALVYFLLLLLGTKGMRSLVGRLISRKKIQ